MRRYRAPAMTTQPISLLALAAALFSVGGAVASSGAELDDVIRQVETHLEAGELDAATAAVTALKSGPPADPAQAARIANLEAVVAFARRDFPTAAERFAVSVESAPAADLRATHAYNAALAAARAGDTDAYERYAGIVEQSVEPGSALPGDLVLERGLNEAAEASPLAFEVLETFLRRFPDHPRVAHAEITLAELYLTQVPSQPVAAREQIDAARERPLSLYQREWLDYVAIWVEAAAETSEKAVERARRFLQDWPQSDRRPNVLMVLGESFYRIGDHTNAMTHFEQLASETPDSAFAETALFFAAKSASLTLALENHDRAITLWTRVAEGTGPLAAPARHEIGLLELARDDFDRAIAAFQAIETMPTVDADLRVAARADRGEALYAKAAATGNDPATLQVAITVFSAIQSDPTADKAWRLQAAVRHGKCLEALGRNDEALALYSTVVRDGAPAGPVAAVPVAEFDWFYRAGLAAIQLLQAGEKWQEAVAIADQVALSGGPRATEAAHIGEKLRLRHFIWQDPVN